MNCERIFSALFSARALMLLVGVILVSEGYRAVTERSMPMRDILTLAEDTFGKWAVIYGWFWIILGILLILTAVFAGSIENTAIWNIIKGMA